MIHTYIKKRIFLPEKTAAMEVSLDSVTFQKLRLQTQEGNFLTGLQYLTKSATRTLLYFHGNGGCAMSRASLVSPIADRHTNVIVADYRGYGANEGIPSEKGLTIDAEAYINYAISLKKPVVILGHSLGGAVAILAIHKTQNNDMNLVTLGAMASTRFFVPKLIRRTRYPKFDSLNIAPNITVPWKILHEVRDDVVPFGHGMLLHNATISNNNVKFIPLVGGDHTLDIEKIKSMLFS